MNGGPIDLLGAKNLSSFLIVRRVRTGQLTKTERSESVQNNHVVFEKPNDFVSESVNDLVHKICLDHEMESVSPTVRPVVPNGVNTLMEIHKVVGEKISVHVHFECLNV
jgi:hypothetical protein